MGKLHGKHEKRSNEFPGKISLQLPHYLSLKYNEVTRKATMTVEDRNVRKQREMWGELLQVSTEAEDLTII